MATANAAAPTDRVRRLEPIHKLLDQLAKSTARFLSTLKSTTLPPSVHRVLRSLSAWFAEARRGTGGLMAHLRPTHHQHHHHHPHHQHANKHQLNPVVVSLLALIVLLLPLSLSSFHSMWQQKQLRPAVCQPGDKFTLLAKPAGGLPKVIFLAGVEGSGHDLFESLFKALPVKLAIEQFQPEMHLTSGADQQTALSEHGGTAGEPCPKFPYSRSTYDFGAQMSMTLKERLSGGEVAYVRARDPFPMGRVRTPLARADPIAMDTLNGIMYDLKVLVLTRNLTETVLWSISRNFHNDDNGLQARLLEASLVYLDASLRMLRCSTFAILNVDAFLQKPRAAAFELAHFLGLPGVSGADILSALGAVRVQWETTTPYRSPRSTTPKPATSGNATDGDATLDVNEGPSPVPTFRGQSFEHFFGHRRRLWPLIDASNGIPFFVANSPDQWPH